MLSTLSKVPQPKEQNDAPPKALGRILNTPEEIILRVPETLGKVIEVRDSPGKGLGIFALKDIQPNQLLLCEAPLVILTDTGTRIDPLKSLVNSLSPARKKAYLSLHGYRYNPHESIYRSILYSNGFGVNESSTGVFEIASRFNHSCIPNAIYRWDTTRGRMVYVSRVKVEQGEEIMVDYGQSARYLERYYGFACSCGRCRDSSMGNRNNEVVNSDRAKETLRIEEVLNEAMSLLDIEDTAQMAE